MSERIVTMSIPDELYEQIEHIAEASERSIEAVLFETIAFSFSEPAKTILDDQLAALDSYTDAQLRALIYRRIPSAKRARYDELKDIAAHRSLTTSEAAEIEQYVEVYDSFVLLRSKVLSLLQQRGYDIDALLKTA